MALLGEFVLTPDVFDVTSYSSEEVCRILLQQVKEMLLNEGIVRNLRNGNWFLLFSEDGRTWHIRGKELLRKLRTQGRLRDHPPALQEEPTDDYGWCREALATHETSPITGIIATRIIAGSFKSDSLIAPIDRLSSVQWWSERSPSIRLNRTQSAYEENLRLILQCSNSVMFIDPHLDPTLSQYSDFIYLLLMMKDKSPKPLIEIHRVCYVGSGRNREFPSESEWKDRFQNAWSQALSNSGLSVEVFIWDDFHDRYLISDLIGINVPYGFDTSRKQSELTTWTRLGRKERDDVQREFDPSSKRHNPKYRFKVP